MTKLLSCRYNMDTNRVEAQFKDGTIVAIDCMTASPLRTNMETPRHSEQSWTGCCTISRWSTHSSC